MLLAKSFCFYRNNKGEDMAIKEEPKHSFKVGDKLAFRCGGISSFWEVHAITKITPSGRIVCGRFTLNPDLTVRGRGGYHGPYRGEPVTEDIRKDMLRAKNLQALNRCKFSELTDEQLDTLAQLIRTT